VEKEHDKTAKWIASHKNKALAGSLLNLKRYGLRDTRALMTLA
jgi:hypothetical protein